MREGMLWRYGKWRKDDGRGLKIRFCEDREGVREREQGLRRRARDAERLLTLMEFCAFGGGSFEMKNLLGRRGR
jgi:hypothetical protein